MFEIIHEKKAEIILRIVYRFSMILIAMFLDVKIAFRKQTFASDSKLLKATWTSSALVTFRLYAIVQSIMAFLRLFPDYNHIVETIDAIPLFAGGLLADWFSQ